LGFTENCWIFLWWTSSDRFVLLLIVVFCYRPFRSSCRCVYLGCAILVIPFCSFFLSFFLWCLYFWYGRRYSSSVWEWLVDLSTSSNSFVW
jgi:hypothetical protein